MYFNFNFKYINHRFLKDADEIFSPAILIGSLSTVTHLILQLNIGLRISYSETSVALQHYSDILKTTALSSIYLALRFVASSLYAEKIYEEKRKCLRNLHDQTREDVWTPDLDLLIVNYYYYSLKYLKTIYILKDETIRSATYGTDWFHRLWFLPAWQALRYYGIILIGLLISTNYN